MAASTEVTPAAPSTSIRANIGPDQQLAEINRKLDMLTDQVGYLYGRTAALEELRNELVPVARDAMGALSDELQAIEHEFNSEEVVYLLRKLLRNTPRFIRLLDRLESLDGLTTELEPLGKEVVRTVVNELEVIEQRGHFRVLRGGLAALDRVASHYTQEDIDQFIDNVVLVVDTVLNLTRPQVLAVANKAAEAIDVDDDGPSKVGLWKLMRAMREPEVQAGLGVGLAVLRKVGASMQTETQEKTGAEAGEQETPPEETDEE